LAVNNEYNVQMTDSHEISRDELIALLDLAGELTTQVDHHKVVLAILEQACAFTNSPEGSVLLYDPIRKGLYFSATRGPKGDELLQKFGERSNQRIPLEGSKAGQAFRSGEITVSSNVQEDTEHFKNVDDQISNVTISVISVPLKITGSIVGVLQLLNKINSSGEFCPYDGHDCAVLEHLGRIAAAAINNVRLVQKLTAQTGLYAREGVSQYLEMIDQPARPERLTALFADMRGFTQLCQTQSDATRTQEILNDFLGMLADQVLLRGGIVNKFVGDAVFAFFQGEGAPAAAVRCAFDMQERFDSLLRRWTDECNEDLSFIDIGIGIATGTAAVGSFGSAEVKNFTAIGTVINLASAFESAARNGRRVLVDNSTWAASRHIVLESEGPLPFVLGKPDQGVKIRYQHYYLKRLTPDRPVRVFLSHNHHDREYVETRIREPLARRNVETWYAEQDIVPGDDYIHRIQNGLLQCDWMLVILTASAAASDWVRAEVNTALKDPRFQGRVVPVRVDNALPDQASTLGSLDVLDVSASPNAGEAIYEFLVQREKQIRAVH
jgi:class 3 adenylate cyclase/putative methionine-R-sulfoxide reductase with GAF domain